MNITNLDKFHDWMIGPINTNWEDGKIDIILELNTKYNIEIIDFKNSTISRLLKWGESHFVNKITYVKTELNTWLLNIELQSGDILEFEGSEINITEIPSK